MKAFNFIPEGWQDEISNVNKSNINQYIEENQTLQGIVQSCDKDYNLHINLGNGITGIIPRKEVEDVQTEELPNIRLCTGKVHKYVQFKIKDFSNENTALLSRREVQQEVIDTIKRDLEVGQNLTGIVRNIKPYGAFIEIGGGVVGLAHIEDLSIARIQTPYERLKIGQKVNVVVKYIDKQTGRINLSYKEHFGTWEDNIKNFSTGMNVEGIIRETEKNKNGVFIELTPNLVGMAEYTDKYKYGQRVNVYIKKIDSEKKKIKLLIKENNSIKANKV